MIAESKEVITKVEKLNNEQQKQIAKMLNEEIIWDTTLKNSKAQLRKLTQETLAEHKSGKMEKSDSVNEIVSAVNESIMKILILKNPDYHSRTK
jgi:ADP-ribosylglycohydrolase